MGFFDMNYESPEQKEERKKKELLSKYGLEELENKKDVESIRKIIGELIGTGIMETGMTFSFNTKPEQSLPVYYQRAMLEQNWIIIRQLDQLNKNIEKLEETLQGVSTHG